MDKDPKIDDSQTGKETENAEPDTHSAARRRLLKAGVVGAPVILSLQSTSAHAWGWGGNRSVDAVGSMDCARNIFNSLDKHDEPIERAVKEIEAEVSRRESGIPGWWLEQNFLNKNKNDSNNKGKRKGVNSSGYGGIPGFPDKGASDEELDQAYRKYLEWKLKSGYFSTYYNDQHPTSGQKYYIKTAHASCGTSMWGNTGTQGSRFGFGNI